LNNGILTIRATDTIRVTTATPIAGAPFSSSKYIALQKGATTTGVLRMDALTTPSLFPIGSLTKYIPVTLSPTASMNFAVSVFEGATVDGTVAVVPVSTTIKDESVDANWIINRMSGTGNCGVTLNWPASLEGTTFSGFPDALIGISHYNSGTSSYDPPIGTANNTTNTADAAFSAFSPFLLTKNPLGLPVTLTAVYALKLPVGTKIIWNVASENSIIKYVVERSNNGLDFTTVGSVNAANYPSYSLNDLTPNKNVFYYRIKTIGYAGYVKYSAAVKVSNGGKQELTVYPNPAKDQIFISGLNNNSEVKIVNSKGQMMLQQKTNASTFSMDISSLVNGMYVVEIYSEGRLLDSKTIIKK
jgi:hypothetical protein